jgi:hypothetical protein
LRARRGRLLVAVALGMGSSALLAFEDGPPERTSGGFGEDSCHACHFDHPENDPSGSLTLSGLPEVFIPGRIYSLVLTIEHPDLTVAGFQMAARSADEGAQSGRLEVAEPETVRVALTIARDVQYAQHRKAGIATDSSGTIRWSMQWTAPDEGEPVVVYAAAVAGDGDGSQIGDRVYTLSRTVQPKSVHGRGAP